MPEFLEKIIPNVLDKPDALAESIQETLVMTLWSGVLIFVLGMFFGIILTVQNRVEYAKTKAFFRCWINALTFFVPFRLLFC